MKALIEKYFEGETSLEEEARLRDYFNSGEGVAEDLREFQPLFQHFSTERDRGLSDDFDEALFQKMDLPDTKVVRMNTRPRHLLRIAAVGAVLVGAMFFLQKNNSTHAQQASIDWSKYEIKDEKIAYEETVKALKLLSNKLNKGTKRAGEEMKELEKVGKYFN
ncbi:MAG: hypothetical protein K9J37_17130 [Saprospiraceae bacterium]|nr:hypothetical protein [Saprospiraceae bacterium]MCF8251641.1 hypothetical protein [Saprospiraceae bacterium]MCF8312269.1 hypothetical protein [Saprospiraceae bacterium]MCF8441977.1 hypothetical protein [Saprospiraceae bacterium]